MAIQPLGIKFEVRSPMRSGAAKAAIRQRLKSWMDADRGARGWIAGPFICLWSSVLNRHGPMLFGRIGERGFQTHIVGRAGSDLNGTLMCLLLGPAMLGLFALDWANGGDATPQFLFVMILFAVLIPLTLWMGHSDRHEGDHLIRFLEDVISEKGKRDRVDASRLSFVRPLSMDFSGEELVENVSAEAVFDALRASTDSDFIILSADEQTYLQTLTDNRGTVIERRDGDATTHRRALRRGAAANSDRLEDSHFTFEETWAVISAYVTGAALPPNIDWHPLDLPSDPYLYR